MTIYTIDMYIQYSVMVNMLPTVSEVVFMLFDLRNYIENARTLQCVIN